MTETTGGRILSGQTVTYKTRSGVSKTVRNRMVWAKIDGTTGSALLAGGRTVSLVFMNGLQWVQR